MQVGPFSLIDEVTGLRADVSFLREEVQELRQAFEQLRINQDNSESRTEFSVVLGGEAANSNNTGSGNTTASASTGYPARGVSASSGGEFAIGSRSRNAILRQIGNFLAAALAGNYRGESGRDSLPLRSQLWVVVKGIDNTVYDPPRIFRRWALAKALVKRGEELGDSVFVGLPAESDCREALRVAGLGYPERIEG